MSYRRGNDGTPTVGKLAMFIFAVLLVLILLSGGRALADEFDTTGETCRETATEIVCETQQEEHEYEFTIEPEPQPGTETLSTGPGSIPALAGSPPTGAGVAKAPAVRVPARVRGAHGHLHHKRHAARACKRHERRAWRRVLCPAKRTGNSPRKEIRDRERKT